MGSFGPTLLWSVIGFFMGALPIAVLLARLFARRDPRDVGDHSPGSANAWRVAGPLVGFTSVILEGLKGFIPVALAYWGAHISGWAILPIMISPLLGHMFSPFLRWRGGKGIAPTFGIWMGLTLWRVPLFFGLVLCLLVLFVRLEDAWTVMAAWFLVSVYMVWSYPSAPVLATAVANYGLLFQRHARDLHPPLFKERRQAS
ncbi:MAG: glycerol-3-phosphate acyltransferase [Candidatus Cryosericum sp.]